jgi:hypothetical protein
MELVILKMVGTGRTSMTTSVTILAKLVHRKSEFVSTQLAFGEWSQNACKGMQINNTAMMLEMQFKITMQTIA